MVGDPRHIPQSIRSTMSHWPIEDVRAAAENLDRARSILKDLARMGDGRSEYLAADVMIRYGWVRQLANEMEAARK